MPASPVARVYAEALFGIAKERSAVDDLDGELHGFFAILAGEEEAFGFLTSPTVDKSSKKELIRSSLEGNASDTLADFLCLLVDKRRFASLPLVAEAFRELADTHAGRARATLTSAAPVPDDTASEMAGALGSALDRKIVLERKVNPDLLGGAVVTIGDKVYNGSVTSQLQRFRKRIMRSYGNEDQG
ncbi:MAG: ATP synthase F1 subunit delta [Gemmatimonadota bacterium]|jgi:F-type H+-transporting ATPase subunit delta|nr:ATP synthase F1 subunit delta [Gemmatimonadota bacterium]MDP6528341.1 ATP synthase F1 subunit delta [Gemmatimonadota bacterium]MDP6802433.1 ATP synthase F1 subunit delta [Gemmatimonadota bacterium]MDP7031010.1 ATP synthase F1 subunit delta [Gemmatimonadota bacterium]